MLPHAILWLSKISWHSEFFVGDCLSCLRANHYAASETQPIKTFQLTILWSWLRKSTKFRWLKAKNETSEFRRWHFDCRKGLGVSFPIFWERHIHLRIGHVSELPCDLIIYGNTPSIRNFDYGIGVYSCINSFGIESTEILNTRVIIKYFFGAIGISIFRHTIKPRMMWAGNWLIGIDCECDHVCDVSWQKRGGKGWFKGLSSSARTEQRKKVSPECPGSIKTTTSNTHNTRVNGGQNMWMLSVAAAATLVKLQGCP